MGIALGSHPVNRIWVIFHCPCFLGCTISKASVIAGIVCKSSDLGLVDFRGFCPYCGTVFRDRTVYSSVL